MCDRLSSRSLEEIDVDTWSKNKLLMRPKRIDSDSDDFTVSGKNCLTRALLQTERRLFGNAEEITFEDSGKNVT